MTGSIVPLFDGLPLFGSTSSVVRVEVNPVARMTRGFAGLNGLISKRLGTRGATLEATGFLNYPTLGQLVTAQGIAQNYIANGGAYGFLDTGNRTWPAVILISWSCITMIEQDEQGHGQGFRAEMLALRLPGE